MADIENAVPGTIVWVDLQTPDLGQAREFYGELLGWSFSGGEDPKRMFYTLAQLRGRNVAGLAKLGETAPRPPAWSVYFGCESADETAQQVVDAGGKLLMGPHDAMEAGRMAFFADPTGAQFAVWQGKQSSGAQIVNEPGAMTWHEVYTRDVQRAREFYGRVFGLEAKRIDAPGIEYWTLHRGGLTIGGAMQMGQQMPPSQPPQWNTYFAVANADVSAKQVLALGGTVKQPPFDTPYGRMASVRDPSGAAFCLIQPPR